jgi:hypothetical protein
MVFDETSGKVFAPISQSSLEQDRAKEAERLQRERELREQLYPVRVTVEGLNSTAITYRIDDGPEISGKGSLGTPGLKVFALPLTIEAKSRITISTKYVYEVQGLRFVLNGRSVVPEWRTEKGKKFRVQAERWAGDSRGIPTFRTATTTFERP